MSTRARQYTADVVRREQLSDHFVRLVLAGEGLTEFVSTGVADEWVGLVVPGQFQSRYYTVRSWDGVELILDVVVHAAGLVTEWATGDCVGDTVTLTEPKSSFDMPVDAAWLLLVGDLTALPAMARIAESVSVPTKIWAEAPVALTGYLPAHCEVTWLEAPEHGTSALAGLVETIGWPQGRGYFWMAGESAQMRAIRKHLMRERKVSSSDYDVMGYWRSATGRQLRAVDPAPIHRAGKASGKNDDQIWADYDAAREES